jgi:2'-5' RNA ligase
MKSLLGFTLKERQRKDISAISENIGSVFDGQEIPVRWVNPDNYHITVQFLGYTSIFRKIYLNLKLRRFTLNNFDISIGNIRLGRSRRFKGMVFLDFAKGGEDLRDLRLQLSNLLGIKDNNQFVPHITIGRINKDLTNQEYSNLIRDIENVTKDWELSEIKFRVEELSLIENKEEIYTVVKNF